MKYGLKDVVVTQIQTVFAGFPEVESAILYGSRAKGTFRPGSDIDLVLCGEQVNQSILNRISLKLDDLLLPYTFDLSIFHHIDNVELIRHIQRVGQVFYRRRSSALSE